ncbi:MAG: polysaccharide deacetylase family protein [Dysgonamonadaceae bacterium]|nr:polysaccharide deacetylase family protein [Dysgonamonadaceae bacterium]
MIYLVIFILLLLGFLVYASAYIGSGIYVKAECRIPTDEKLIALTFDDGPNAITTPKILSILKKYEIKAVFFCTGKQLENNLSLAQRIADEGHIIGNHTFNHNQLFPFYSVKKMSLEIEKCGKIIEKINQKNTEKFFRPPFGVTNPNLRKALKNKGYRVIGWNIRSLDTVISSPNRLLNYVMNKITPGSIILFHDTKPQTVDILEKLIISSKEKGYDFSTL